MQPITRYLRWLRRLPLLAVVAHRLAPQPRRPVPATHGEPQDGVHPLSWVRAASEIHDLLSDTVPREEKLYYMKMAIEEARKSPFHPTVGAVIVRDGQVVARGFRDSVWIRRWFRRPRVRLRHAEEVALSQIPGSLEGATLYATLEPCFERWTRGAMIDSETCSSALVRRGIRTVVVGLIDNDPRTRGKGIRYLVDNGVTVERVSDELEEDLCSLVGNGKFWHAAPGRGRKSQRAAETSWSGNDPVQSQAEERR